MPAKILILEDDEDLGILIQRALANAGHESSLVANASQALALAERLQPGLIIAADSFFMAHGASFHQRARSQAATSATPILILSAVAREILPPAVANDAAAHYMAKPYNKEALLQLVDNLLAGEEARNAPAKARATILIVEDDLDISALLKHTLEAAGHEIFESHDGPDAMRKLGLSEPPPENGIIKPDLIILDVILPVVDGYTIGTQLKENDRTSAIPIVVVTAKRGMRELFQAAPNVVSVLDKPLDFNLVKRHVAAALAKTRG